MSDSILFQKQVRDNSTDLHSYVKELSNWEEEMKRKEISRDFKEAEDLPPVRSKNIRKSNSPKPIPSTDYSSWDKFDVDAACEQLDNDFKAPTKEELQMQKDIAYIEKENGNKFVKAKNWTEAIKCYTKAIKGYASDPVFYANRALCYLKMKEYVNAEIDCTNSLRLDSNYVKALQRRAAARLELAQLNEAYRDLTKVMQLEPNNRESLAEVTKLKKKLNIVDQPKFKRNDAATTEKVILPKPKPTLQSESMEKTKKMETISISEDPEANAEVQEPSPAWSELNDRTLIRPVVKPPHLRSKKPLKRVEVQEIVDTVSHDPNLAKTESRSKMTSAVSKPNVKEESGHVQKEQPEVEKPPNYLNIDVFPLPKTCLQFSTTWKIFGDDIDLKFKYFTKIPYTDLANLFQEFLESDLFFDVIKTLNTHISEETGGLIWNYLNSFTNVKRFSTIMLFAGPNEKSLLRNILDSLSTLDHVDQADVHKLKEVYKA